MPEHHQPHGHFANDNPVVPISKDKLKNWHEKMERLEALRVAMKNLPVSRREKETLDHYTEQMRSTIEYVQFELKEKMEGKRLKYWDI
jgi:benzoyl-CoA reductase/2-hydroxyglutaryl-CoA dehydratase subunit BcrC/BadD/HgdB